MSFITINGKLIMLAAHRSSGFLLTHPLAASYWILPVHTDTDKLIGSVSKFFFVLHRQKWKISLPF